jgi:hypothetical protein
MTASEPDAELVAELDDEAVDADVDEVFAAGCVAAVLGGSVAARPNDWRRPPDTRPAPGRRPPRRWDRGSATAEMAVALPSLMMFLLAGVLAVNAIAVKVQCVAAAREGALSAARGESGEAAARRVAPTGASVSVTVDGERAVVTVTAGVGSVGRFLGTFTVKGTSSAAVEPGLP